MELLTIHNCHRASKVRRVASPETIWEWHYCTEPCETLMGEYYSKAVAPDGQEAVMGNIDKNLNDWEVVEFAYEYNFQDLYKQAYEAFYCTSHCPDNRALSYIRSYEKDFLEDIKCMPEGMVPDYYEKFRAKIIDLFAKHSRCMSAAITGSARFPTERNRRANNVYDEAAKAFLDWREIKRKAGLSRIEAAKPQEQRDNEALAAIRKDIMQTAATLLAIDTKQAPYYRTSFVTNLSGRLTTIAKTSTSEFFDKVMTVVNEASDKIVEKGGKPIFTPRHKIWKLAEEIAKRVEKEAEMQSKEDAEIVFEGGRIVKNYSENRLQIFHDEKPPQEVINILKHEGWKWSRFFGCWQRQLTTNALWSASRIIIGGEYEKMEERSEFVKTLNNA